MAFGFFKDLLDRFGGKSIDWDELEESLIRADIGVPMTLRIVQELQQREGKITANDVIEVTRRHIEQILPITHPKLRPLPNRPKVILMAGVNGTGKTTSAAKLAYLLKEDRHKVDVIAGEYNADPAALCYDAYSAANKRNIEFLICDTAGRLHTKSNLMQELGKIVRTLGKHDEQAPHECLLVVDATTGSNALVQAREFKQAVGLTGLVITKLDGSGKGGIAIAIQDELAIAPRFVGTGEKPRDLHYFNRDEFVANLL
jgi:fused signal recognition particle receptor